MFGVLIVLLAIVLLGGVVITLVSMARARVEETVVCPSTGEETQVVFERELDARFNPGRRVDVCACGKFPDPTKVTCGKLCIAAGNRADEQKA